MEYKSLLMASSEQVERRHVALVLGLALLAGLVACWAPLHVHASATAGYYSEVHVLESLAALASEGSLPGPVPAPWVSLTTAALACWLATALPVQRARRTHCRAPPRSAPLLAL